MTKISLQIKPTTIKLPFQTSGKNSRLLQFLPPLFVDNKNALLQRITAEIPIRIYISTPELSNYFYPIRDT